jgi:hypothetical protein
MKYLCPVCFYDQLDDPPYDDKGCASFEICPCCGTEFGYDDSMTRHDELKKQWLAKGGQWWSASQPPPIGWSLEAQLSRGKKGL